MTTVLLRQVPGTSPIHRLWAGTKLVSVLLVSVLLVVAPTWTSLAVIAALVLIAAVIARISPTAIPRPPALLWGLLALGALINVPVGVDAVVLYGQGLVFAIVLLGASMLIAWTTSMSDVAPAIAVLGKPFKKVGLPIDEWAISVALCLRSLPLLIDEMRVLAAARKVRPKSVIRSASDNSIIDLVTATMSVAIRRSGEMGEAITARGGTGLITAYPSRPKLADLLAIVVVVLACTASIIFG